MGPITRRRLMWGGSALAATALSGNTAISAPSPAKNDEGAAVQNLEFECKFIYKMIEGYRCKLRTYNGNLPGQLIRTRPGQTLRILVKNSLPAVDSRGWDGNHNVPHMFNATNLHLHGLDIIPHLFEPIGTTNPLARMIDIMPGQTYRYEITVPKDQPPGLGWYHPHHHGSTAVQAVSGMAGPLITHGDIDRVPEINAARDIVLAVSDIGLFPSDTEPNVWTYEPRQNATWITKSGNVQMYDPKSQKMNVVDLKGGFTTGDYQLRFYLLNGRPFFQENHNTSTQPGEYRHPVGKQLTPQRFTIAPGEVVRFRMLNACSDNFMPIVVEGHDMHLIAMDGVNFEQVVTMPAVLSTTPKAVLMMAENASSESQVPIPPGGRAEFLIRGGNPGIYKIVQLEQSQQFLRSDQKIVAEIEVSGVPKNMDLPTKLPSQRRYYPLIKPEEVKRVRNFVFSGVFPGVENPYVGMDFLINNNTYGEREVAAVVPLEGVEEWHIQVSGSAHDGAEGHPFHIHVNHFELISIDGKPPAYTAPVLDTVWVPLNAVVVIRNRFRQFRGKSVFHCHILPHEDTGMMANFLIL